MVSHVQRRYSGHIGQRMLKIELPGEKKRGRPQRRLVDVVKEIKKMVGVTEEEARVWV